MNSKYENNISLIIFLIIIGVLTYNIFHYLPILGYDGEAHHAYVQNFLNIYYPEKTNQPSINFTYEYYSPPIPYLLPSFINEICKWNIQTLEQLNKCRDIYGTLNILFLSFLFIFIFIIYFKLFNNVLNNNKFFYLSILLTIGIFSANYKAISMIRGEVYIVFFNSLLLYNFSKLIMKNFEYNKKDILIFGTTVGLLALSRQWAFLLFPSYFLLYFFIPLVKRKIYIKFIFLSFMLGLLISGWFYLDLYIEYGSLTPFNINPNFYFFNNISKNYKTSFLDNFKVFFNNPIRPNFNNYFFPVLYSDLWGDYWGYFSFTSRDLLAGKNQMKIGGYLGRVNLISLFPTFYYLFTFSYLYKSILKKNKSKLDIIHIHIFLSILVVFFGYWLFFLIYQNGSGDTVKSVYILQLFHFFGLSASLYFEKLRRKNKKSYVLIILLFLFVFIHNISAMTSHFQFIF